MKISKYILSALVIASLAGVAQNPSQPKEKSPKGKTEKSKTPKTKNPKSKTGNKVTKNKVEPSCIERRDPCLGCGMG